MLVGNKKDLEHLRAVATEKGEDLAKREGLCFMETSALDTTNVDEAFESLIAKIYESVSKRHISTGKASFQSCFQHKGSFDSICIEIL